MHWMWLAVACGPADDTPAEAPLAEDPVETLRTHEVLPSAVDDGVIDHSGPHLVWVPPTAAQRDQLLLFYPGTGAQGGDYTDFLAHAAGLGFHVIALSYDNRDSVNFDVCWQVEDPQCHTLAREEVLLGGDGGYDPPLVDPANGALPRFVGLLGWLRDAHPDEGWDLYLTGDGLEGVSFDRITVAGHSQGAGHAAFTARLFAVDRGLMFNGTEGAPWTDEPLATAPDRLFAVRHLDEFGSAAMGRSWDQLGLSGVDTPFETAGAGQRWVTDRADCRGEGNAALHNCIVGNDFVPLEADQPVWIDAWTAILGGE